MKTNRLLFITLLAFAAPFASAQSAAPAASPSAAPKSATKGPAQPYPLKVCLVTDSDLDSMGDEVSIVHEGRVIKFCCKPCEKKFLRNPDKYLAKLAAKQAGGK